MEITFSPDRRSNPVRWTQSPTLYHVAIKAGLYRKTVQVYHIPIPGDKYFIPVTSYLFIYLFIYLFLSKREKKLGFIRKIRQGRVTVNTDFYLFGLILHNDKSSLGLNC